MLSPVRDTIGVELNPYVITAIEVRNRLASGDHFLKEVLSSPKIFLKGGDDELAELER